MRAFAVAAFVCLQLLVVRSADAQVEAPQGSIGFIGQLQQNTGAAQDAYRYAWLVGVNANYDVARISNIAFGAAWSLAGGSLFDAAENRADDTVRVLEMSLGLQVRRVLGDSTPRFLVAGAGATILRLDRALPPDDERLYTGPYGTIGLEQFLGASTTLSFAVRYGLIGVGPAALAVRVGVSWGS